MLPKEAPGFIRGDEFGRAAEARLYFNNGAVVLESPREIDSRRQIEAD